MNADSQLQPAARRPGLLAGILTRVATVLAFFVVIAAILFLASGRLDWTWAWVYLGISLALMLINATIMLRTNPEQVAERGRMRETRDWDKIVGGLWGLAIYMALPLVAALDIRFAWSGDVTLPWHLAGTALLVISYAISAWALIANTFFSTAVRIQTDRGHTVCNTGPYRFVRHPGYVGFILQSLSMPLLFGSWWALVPGIVAAALMALRTALEDRVLQAELPGYREYAAQVRYRLLPGVW